MTTDQPPPRGEIPALGRLEKGILGTVVLGALGGAGLGLYSSFDSVSAAATRWGFDPSWILPIALDVSIPVFSLANLLLTRFDMALAWVRLVPWGLTAVTVYMNVEAAGSSFAAQIGHGALPMLWVVLSEIVAHVYRTKIGAVTGRRMEGVRRSRWLLAPTSTAALWRRMKLWEIVSYRTALRLERNRILARVDLREEFGWGWRWNGKARRERALLRLGELEPQLVPERVPVPVVAAAELEPAQEAAIAEPSSELELEQPRVPLTRVPELEPEQAPELEQTPVPELEPGPELELEQAPEPELEPEPAERNSTPVNLNSRAAKRNAQVREVLELLEQFGTDVVDHKYVTDNTRIPRTTAYHRLNEALELWNERQAAVRNSSRFRNEDPVPNLAGPFDLELEPGSEQRTGT
jgi:hypothetical protein